MNTYLRTINNTPIYLNGNNLDLPALAAGGIAFDATNMEDGKYVNSSGAYNSGYSGKARGIDMVPLVEDLYLFSRGLTASYCVLGNTGSTTSYRGSGNTVYKVSKDLGAFVRFSTYTSGTNTEVDFNTELFAVMGEGGRRANASMFKLATDEEVTWEIGNATASGDSSSSNYLRSSWVSLDDLAAIDVKGNVPFALIPSSSTSGSSGIVRATIGGYRTLTNGDLLKIWPNAKRVRVVYGDGSTTYTSTSAASNVEFRMR